LDESLRSDDLTFLFNSLVQIPLKVSFSPDATGLSLVQGKLFNHFEVASSQTDFLTRGFGLHFPLTRVSTQIAYGCTKVLPL
jgi:hypothetical protein